MLVPPIPMFTMLLFRAKSPMPKREYGEPILAWANVNCPESANRTTSRNLFLKGLFKVIV